MSKAAIVYWSGTGNTEQMADILDEALKEAGVESEKFAVSTFSADKIADYDVIAFGCPAMGAEVLEEDEFEPAFAKCEGSLAGKKIALFGSFGWGDGEWMRDWSDRCNAAGAVQVCDFVICNEAPDSDAENAIKAMAASIAGA